VLALATAYDRAYAYDLILNRHDAEVDNLHRRPDQPVGLERRNVDVLKFALHSALPSTLRHGHESEEARKT
jgi:hypothetical protein